MLTEHKKKCTRNRVCEEALFEFCAEGCSGRDSLGGNHCQPHPGTQCHRYGCSLPGLTRFTANRCEGTDRVAITHAPAIWCAAIVLICARDARDATTALTITSERTQTEKPMANTLHLVSFNVFQYRPIYYLEVALCLDSGLTAGVLS